ncbi:MAG: putative metallopeptidase [Myxococcota bacterium]
MTTRFEVAQKNETIAFTKCIEELHSWVTEGEVNVGLLICRKTAGGEPVQMRQGGYPIAGKVHITNAWQRAQGLPDLLLIVDGDYWDDSELEERVALLDHLLSQVTHVDVENRDEQGRPKLKKRKFDFRCMGFKHVAKRHGHASVEMQQLTRVVKSPQLELPLSEAA